MENEVALYDGRAKAEDRQNAMVEAATSRAAQEVQAAMVIAKRYPRNVVASEARIIAACTRKGLAEESTYTYSRGGTKITGPSIRLAEAMAQNWGNLDFGIIELQQSRGESHVMAYAWDLETNARQVKVFTVAHVRRTGKNNVPLDDPRDIYETVANNGARRLRACILGIIPGDIQDSALEQCRKTLAGDSKEPLVDRARKMVTAFSDFGVTLPMIEGYLQHKIEAVSEQQLAKLRGIYTGLKDGVSKREDFFDLPEVEQREPEITKSEKLLGKIRKPDKAAETSREAMEKAERLAGQTPDPDPKKTPRQELEELVTGVGKTYGHLVKFVTNLGMFDISKYPSFDDLPGDQVQRLLRAKAGLLRGLKELE